MPITREDWDRLQEIREEMLELFHEAKGLLRGIPKHNYDRAKAYWMAQVEMALTNDHSYLGGSGCSMEDTLNEVEPNGSECASCLEVTDTDELVQCGECGDEFCEVCCAEEECIDCKSHA